MALREQVWIKCSKEEFNLACPIYWRNKKTAFNFHVDHINPESKGGATTIDHLKPMCAICNLSMPNNYKSYAQNVHKQIISNSYTSTITTVL